MIEIDTLARKAGMDLARQKDEYIKSKVRGIWFRFPLKHLVKFFLILNLSSPHFLKIPSTISGTGITVEWPHMVWVTEKIEIVCKYKWLEWIFFRRR